MPQHKPGTPPAARSGHAPPWQEALARRVTPRECPAADFAGAQPPAKPTAIPEQRASGLGVITDSAWHRQTRDRRSRPNAALSGFRARIPALHAAAGRGATDEAVDPGLADGSDRQIGHRCYDPDWIVTGIIAIQEHKTALHFQGPRGDTQPGAGAVVMRALALEAGEQAVARSAAHRRVVPGQIIITGSCSFKQPPRDIAFGKMRAMKAATTLFTGKLYRSGG